MSLCDDGVASGGIAPPWLAQGEIRVLDPGRANRQACCQQHLLPCEHCFCRTMYLGRVYRPSPRGEGRFTMQQLLTSAPLLIRAVWRGAAALHGGGLEWQRQPQLVVGVLGASSVGQILNYQNP